MANDRHQLIDPVENANAPAVSAQRRGTCIEIAIFDSAIADVVDCGYNRLLLERSKDSGLTWLEITTPDQRPVLKADVFEYKVHDRFGDPNYLYRTRYIDTKTNERSEPSEDIAGAGLALAGLLSVAELQRRYFFGVDLTNDRSEQMGDDVFTHYILAAIRSIETELDIPILPTTFNETHDYYRNDYEAFCFIQLDNYPVISVDEFRVQYPSGQNVVVFPNEWIRLNAEHGQIQIVPTAGTLSDSLVGRGGAFLPAIYSGMDFLPQIFQVTYSAGFGKGQVPRDILDCIGMLAACGPLDIFGDMLGGAGIASLSLSLDGLSQSVNTTSSPSFTGYGARINDYLKRLKQQLPMLRRYYKGVRMVVA